MISTTNIALIQHLKQHPKQGKETDPEKPKYVKAADKTTAKLNAKAQELKKDIENLIVIAENFAHVADALDQENLSLGMGIGKLAKVFDDYETSLVATIKAQTFLEQRNKELNVSFGISSAKAAELGQAYDGMTATLNTGGEHIRKYGQSVDKILPGMSKMIMGINATGKNFDGNFKTQLLGTNQLLSEHIGLTGDAANNYQLYAAGAGQNSLDLLNATQQMADSFDKATGMAGSFSGIVKDISELGSDVQTQYNKLPGSLEKAVVKAKLLGTSFKQIEAMASKMLNIEESVGQELEYQLLSGKRLVDVNGESITEKLRIAKLSGNAEDQVKAMNDLLTTQGDVLDGNNHYAKEQLANLTGFTVAELTRQRQTRKLMESGGMSEAEVNNMLNMDPSDFEKALKGKSASEQGILKSLKESEGQKTTDELYSDMLKRERTEGIRVMLGGTRQTDGTITGEKKQTDVIETAKTEVKKSEGAIKDYIRPFMTETNAQIFGQLQSLGAGIASAQAPVNTIVGMTPGIIGAPAQKVLDAMTQGSNFTLGKPGATGTTGTGTESGNTTVPVPDAKPSDAILVNDAMIQFHPADKFATVSDGAALLASTERGKLDSAVNTLTGGNSNTAVVDPAPIAAAMMAAIQSALGGIKIEMDGEKLNKAMEFGTRTVN
jgi:hypothetical protein